MPDPGSPAPPRVVAVVLTWRGLEDTRRCLQSLLKVNYARLGIVVVDNASGDGTVPALKAEFPGVSILERTANDGYAAGNNAGIILALEQKADFVLILNNDVVVDPGFLQPMVDCFGRHPDAGVVTCKAHFAATPSRIYCTGGKFSSLRCAGISLPDAETGREQEVSFVSGCILMVKPEVFHAVGLFDERFFMYFEDVEFSLRVGKQYRQYYTPDGIVAHKSGGGDSWTNASPLYLYHMTRNRLWLFQRASLPYRIYVGLFSLALAAAKSGVLLVYLAGRRTDRKRTVNGLAAIWRGLRDGYAGSPAPPAGKPYAPRPETLYSAPL